MLLRLLLGQSISKTSGLSQCFRASLRGLATKTDKSDALPDVEYNPWERILGPSEKVKHWQRKYDDLRWEYLQDPKVASGDIVPIIVKDGPERDKTNWPDIPVPENAGRVRMYLFPEEFFNFLYSKTGVTGPYVIIWGALAYFWSQEWIRFESETFFALELTLGPLYLYSRVLAPRMWVTMERGYEFEQKAFNSMCGVITNSMVLENIEQKVLFEQVRAARSLKFKAKKEMFQLQWESTYRERMYEAFEKVKQRLDFFTELKSCKSRHESKHMVNWIVNSVIAGITADQEKATLNKCITDLKAMSATVKL